MGGFLGFPFNIIHVYIRRRKKKGGTSPPDPFDSALCCTVGEGFHPLPKIKNTPESVLRGVLWVYSADFFFNRIRTTAVMINTSNTAVTMPIITIRLLSSSLFCSLLSSSSSGSSDGCSMTWL